MARTLTVMVHLLHRASTVMAHILHRTATVMAHMFHCTAPVGPLFQSLATSLPRTAPCPFLPSLAPPRGNMQTLRTETKEAMISEQSRPGKRYRHTGRCKYIPCLRVCLWRGARYRCVEMVTWRAWRWSRGERGDGHVLAKGPLEATARLRGASVGLRFC
eukprot:1287796-Rhodomonas_salina.7